MATLTTRRLLLRPFEPEDLEPYAAMRTKPEVVRFLPGGLLNVAQARPVAERLVPLFAAEWQRFGVAPWAVVDRASRRLMGHGGLRVVPELGGATEILYMLDSLWWGQGHATELAAAARDFGFGALGRDHLLAMAMPENHASLAVMRRIGMRPVGPLRVFGIDTLCWRIDRAGAAQPAAVSRASSSA